MHIGVVLINQLMIWWSDQHQQPPASQPPVGEPTGMQRCRVVLPCHAVRRYARSTHACGARVRRWLLLNSWLNEQPWINNSCFKSSNLRMHILLSVCMCVPMLISISMLGLKKNISVFGTLQSLGLFFWNLWNIHLYHALGPVLNMNAWLVHHAINSCCKLQNKICQDYSR